MKLNNSNKRISNIIAGILLVFVAFIFIAIASGVIRDHLYLQDKMDLIYIGPQFNLVDHSSGGEKLPSRDIGKNGFVSIAQKCTLGPWNTEPGSLIIVDYYYDETMEFPLCIEPSCGSLSIFDDWYLLVRSEGGYEPCGLYTQTFDLYQKGELVGRDTDGDGDLDWYIGYGITWIELDGLAVSSDPYNIDVLGDSCAVSYWLGVLDMSCNNPGDLDSNQYPDVVDCEYVGTYPDYIPGKEVIAEIISTWCGCDDVEQCFEIILVHISRIPNSRINF